MPEYCNCFKKYARVIFANGHSTSTPKRSKRKSGKVSCSGFYSDSSHFSVTYLTDVWEIKKVPFPLAKVKEINYFQIPCNSNILKPVSCCEC